MLKVQQFQELTGTEYLMADIACMHDKAYEKKQWNERIAHYNSINFNDPKTFKNASNPIGLRAAVSAMQLADSKKESGYLISLDASSSGLQLLSLLVSCPTSWRLCGGDESILDAYMHVYKHMDCPLELERKDIKAVMMTA